MVGPWLSKMMESAAESFHAARRDRDALDPASQAGAEWGPLTGGLLSSAYVEAGTICAWALTA
jgi:hypothetical protein